MDSNERDLVATLQAENNRLQQRVAKLEQEAAIHQQSREDLRTIFNSVNDALFVHTLDDTGTILDVNQHMLDLYQVSREEATTFRVQDYSSPANNPEDIARVLTQAMAGEVPTFPWRARRPRDGSEFDVEVTLRKIIFCQQPCILAVVRDLSEQQKYQAERTTLQQQIIDAQRDTLRELSTPLIPISDKVVIMPLIGTIDSQRAQQILEALLTGVAQHQADLAILDITGVQIVDTQVAQALIQAAQAVKMLGATVMLTGIQPQIAQTLVHLGVDLSGIITRGTLQAGIADALRW